MLTIMQHKKKLLRVEIFARFVGLSAERYYTNDDLTFFYRLNKTFVNK